MIKNITVVDENGNRIGSTYPKRASGLVKKGRAHWIDENSVCLCAHNTEEIKMPNNIYDVIDNQFSKLQSQLNCIENNDKVAMSMIETLAGMQNRNRTLDIVEKQLSIINEEIKKEEATDDERLALMREATRQQKLRLLESLVNGDKTNKTEDDETVPDICEEQEETVETKTE